MKTIALFFLNRALTLFLGELWAFLKEAMNHVRKAGLDISSSLVNLGIEAAIQAVRGKSQ